MKNKSHLLLTSIVVVLSGSMMAQNSPSSAENRETSGMAEAAREHVRLLESQFAAALSNATFTGRWCLINEGKLGPEQQDKYTIIEAKKVGGDTWLIHTRVQYGDRDFVAPLPVKVKWAGDTAVIVVDNLAMPGGTRAYSARVVIYEDTYAGTWSGGDHAGLLMGVISRSSTPEKAAEVERAE